MANAGVAAAQNVDAESEERQMTIMCQLKQQVLRAWQPIPTLTKTIVLFLVLGSLFLGVGVPLVILSQGIVEYRVQYDTVCGNQPACQISLNITTTMQGPVFVYYELTNYFQNHRLYAKSLSAQQLAGADPTINHVETACQPIVYNKDLYVSSAIDGTPLIANETANPCGLVAYTVFNDSFQLSQSGNAIYINDSGISWPSDIARYPQDQFRYKIRNVSEMWLNTTSQRVMNWMRIAAVGNFRKLWGRIDADLNPGMYLLEVSNYYNVQPYQASKFFVVATSNFFGSRNSYLSYVYIVSGALCFIVALLFFVRKIKKRKH